MRFLVLVTEAFGGRGGIAKFNRDLLAALSMHLAATEIVALPRVIAEPLGMLPEKVTFLTAAAVGRAAYGRAVLRSLLQKGRFDVIICGHINLLPVGYLAACYNRAPLLLIVHGVDAWQAPSRRLTSYLASKIDAFVAVSELTKRRFLEWTKVSDSQGFVIPNCVDLARFGPGPKRRDLLERYGLAGRTIIMTLSRLSAKEQYKGQDEVLEVLPELSMEIPGVAYLVVGDGDDRVRLERKAMTLGVRDRVIFAGYVSEEDKRDYYRLADAFVMPGRGEGFGIVYLEALACGVPVVASNADASYEAVMNGRIGTVVDPGDLTSVRRGIHEALSKVPGVPVELDYFSQERFINRWHAIINEYVKRNKLLKVAAD